MACLWNPWKLVPSYCTRSRYRAGREGARPAIAPSAADASPLLAAGATGARGLVAGDPGGGGGPAAGARARPGRAVSGAGRFEPTGASAGMHAGRDREVRVPRVPSRRCRRQ